MSDCFDHMTDAWDDALFGRTHYGDGGGGYGPVSVVCRYCGTGDLWWFNKRLVTDPRRPKDTPHICKGRSAKVDEFPLIKD